MTTGFQELFEDLQAGRDVRRAQEELYRLVSAALLEPLRGKVPLRARSRLDVEDVLHEAVLRALANVAKVQCDNERQFLAWVYRIARNLITDQAKRMSARAVPFARDRASSTGDDDQSGASATAPRESRIPGRERSAESGVERQDIIESVLAQMREAEADVIRRRWLSGQSFAEVAAALGRTEKAVKGLYGRAWKKFQELARRARSREG
jgi:RNA polymerase sigma-70 factor (ECF subfamily)